jgi:hypothetical protein
MIGKKSSLRILLKCLRILGVTHVFSTRFIQGKKRRATIRWGVAWTFLDVQVPTSAQNNMSYKVRVFHLLLPFLIKPQGFGRKKLRRRRDLCTEVQSISLAAFRSTIDPRDLLALQNFSPRSGEVQRMSHALDYLALANSLKDPAANQPAPRWTVDTCCLCSHCVLALTFLRVFASLSNQLSFLFDRVEERVFGSHTTAAIIFQQAEDESVELCIPVSAILREESNKRRRSSLGSDDEPIKKKTRGGMGLITTHGGDDHSDSESEDDDEDAPVCADEWNEGNEHESAEVEQVEFSIYLSQKAPNRDEDSADVITPLLRYASLSV